MTGHDAKKVAAYLMQQCRENHLQVLELIDALEANGDIEKGELDHYRRLARKWLKIAEQNRERGLTGKG
ncbi:MAG: hypothetical protein E6R14_06460 [Thermomicrobiales bacterium]|nr:MAG: hypothetical protein E6R14_06460 [Thermomicrobiales bacterium]